MSSLTSQQPDDLKLKVQVIALIGARLAKYGAETRLILQSMDTLCRAFELKDAQCAFDSQGTKVTCESPQGQICYYSKVTNYGINMAAVSEYHRICLRAQEGRYSTLEEIHADVLKVKPKVYPRTLIVTLECFAAAAFCYLNLGGLETCLCAAFGAIILMVTRFFLLDGAFFETFTIITSAFLGAAGACAAAKTIDLPFEDAALAMLSTCLVLVPGFPLINGFLDVFKGYTVSGVLRLMHALVVVVNAAVGIIGATYLSSLFY